MPALQSQRRIEPSLFQNAILSIPREFDLFLGGGRGGGKSFGVALLVLREVEQYGSTFKGLYIRKTYQGLQDFQQITLDLFGSVYGKSAQFNAQEHIWRFPNGATFELGQLEHQSDYQKYQGRSFSMLVIDECGQFCRPHLLDRLRSNLRGPENVPLRVALVANPGGPGHAWLSKRYVFREKPGKPFLEPATGRMVVYLPSTYRANPHIDQSQYLKSLVSANANDTELLKAEKDGDWAIARGAFFGSVIDESRNCIDPLDQLPTIGSIGRFFSGEDGKRYLRTSSQLPKSDWKAYLAMDFGSAAPASVQVMTESPGAEWQGRWYPRGSIIICDELYTSLPDDYSTGLGLTVPQLAQQIHKLCQKWGIDSLSSRNVADDSIFARTGSGAISIAAEFKKEGIRFNPAQKGDRVSGWEIMRRMLADAGSPDRSGLYIARNCEAWWQTVPYLARDERNPHDVDTKGIDHSADCSRYGLLRENRTVQASGFEVR